MPDRKKSKFHVLKAARRPDCFSVRSGHSRQSIFCSIFRFNRAMLTQCHSDSWHCSFGNKCHSVHPLEAFDVLNRSTVQLHPKNGNEDNRNFSSKGKFFCQITYCPFKIYSEITCLSTCVLIDRLLPSCLMTILFDSFCFRNSGKSQYCGNTPTGHNSTAVGPRDGSGSSFQNILFRHFPQKIIS